MGLTQEGEHTLEGWGLHWRVSITLEGRGLHWRGVAYLQGCVVGIVHCNERGVGGIERNADTQERSEPEGVRRTHPLYLCVCVCV